MSAKTDPSAGPGAPKDKDTAAESAGKNTRHKYHMSLF